MLTKTKDDPCFIMNYVCQQDVRLTKWALKWASRNIHPGRSRKYYYALEISGHGLVWGFIWILLPWMFPNETLTAMQKPMIIGLIIDLAIVGTLKAVVRRPRPQANRADAIAEFGPDKYSFPSGHASRAWFVVYFFTVLFPSAWQNWPLLYFWAICLSCSRVLMNRHHVFDVVCGVFVGFITGTAVGCAMLLIDR